MRVVADTNVYVSAIIFGGKPQAILDLAQDGQIELFISDDILAEVTRILRDKFKRSPEELRNDLLSLEAITTWVQPTEKIDAVPNDPTDNVMVECAVAARAQVIVSGDNHLIQIDGFRGLKVQRAADFLAGLREPSL